MNSADIEAAAATWFAKREGEDWNAVDQAQLEAWLESSTAHRIAFIRILSAWERAARLSALGVGVPSGTVPPRRGWGFARFAPEVPAAVLQEPKESVGDPELAVAPGGANSHRVQHSAPPGFFRRVGALAVILVLAGAAGIIWYFSTDRADSFRTRIGAVTTVPLSDGSKVTLNTDSQIHVELDPTARRIKLDKGEAFFDVAKDATRPFVVEVADKRVVAVGTQFEVRRDNGEMRVLVLEGTVRIEHSGTSPKSPQTQLAAGSAARTAKAAVLIDELAPALVEQLLSWRTGYLLFRDTALADAVADFNRYSNRKIFIEDAALASIRIGGSFRADDADTFLWLLESGFPIKVEKRSDRIILTKR